MPGESNYKVGVEAQLLGEYALALTHYEAARADGVNHANIYANIATSHLHLGHTVEAVQHYKMAYERYTGPCKDALDFKLLGQIGVGLLFAGEAEQAIPLLNRVIESALIAEKAGLHGDLPFSEIYFRMGEAHYQLHPPYIALPYFRMAHLRDRSNDTYKERYKQIYSEIEGRYSQQWNRLIAEGKGEQALVPLELALYMRRNNPPPSLAPISDQFPGAFDLVLKRGYAFYKKGDLLSAQRYTALASEICPNHPCSHSLMGNILFDLGTVEKEASSGTHTQNALDYYSHAKSMLESPVWDESVRTYCKDINSFLDIRAQSLYEAGVKQYEQGNLDAAHRLLLRTICLKKSPSAFISLGVVLYRLGERDNKPQFYRDAIGMFNEAKHNMLADNPLQALANKNIEIVQQRFDIGVLSPTSVTSVGDATPRIPAVIMASSPPPTIVHVIGVPPGSALAAAVARHRSLASAVALG